MSALGLVLFQAEKAGLSIGSVSVVFLLVSFYADCIVLAVCVSVVFLLVSFYADCIVLAVCVSVVF